LTKRFAVRALGVLVWVLLGSTTACAQTKNWAATLRFGEPTGVGIRKYGDRNALELAVGTYGGLTGVRRAYRQGEYRRVGFSLNAAYFWYTPLFRERLTAYAGLGAQVNSRRYFRMEGLAERSDRLLSVGPTATVGTEYFPRSVPISVFLEGGTYLEFVPDVFFLSPQVNVGIRFNF
jgi:hypothetical protein